MKRYFLLFGSLIILFCACTKSSYNATDQAAIDDARIQKYIAANHLTGMTKDPSGYYYSITTVNPGPHPTVTDTVQVTYTGTLLNGTNFDTESVTTLPLATTIEAWQLAIPKLGANGQSPYGRITLIVPSALGYGTTSSTSIPANSVLVFTIDLLGFY